eukprot:NODE_158_length_15065_cov_0.349125.p5 type:complete len:393 gc:universal NODE_158_length_15065_cov_0.349125:7030-8208(+)
MTSPPVNDKDPMYFGYYGQMQHQQNMLSDHIRTSTYHNAILSNKAVFQDAIVMDLGAGSGILSYFAVQAGAKMVYAVEASPSHHKIQAMLDCKDKNEYLQNKITIIPCKIEDAQKYNIPQVDVLISEPIGVLIFHERMIESYLFARDHYLKSDGHILPNQSNLFFSPYTDATLYSETLQKARFWENSNFYNVDFSPLFNDAKLESFRMPVVGAFDSKCLLSDSQSTLFDFKSMKSPLNLQFKLQFKMNYTGLCHGISSWFDLVFHPTNGQYIHMNTGPQYATTHWQQIRFQFQSPIAVNKNQVLHGWIRMRVNEHRSYTMIGQFGLDASELEDPDCFEIENLSISHKSHKSSKTSEHTQRTQVWYLHEQNFNYSFNYSQPPEYFPEYQCMYE